MELPPAIREVLTLDADAKQERQVRSARTDRASAEHTLESALPRYRLFSKTSPQNTAALAGKRKRESDQPPRTQETGEEKESLGMAASVAAASLGVLGLGVGASLVKPGADKATSSTSSAPLVVQEGVGIARCSRHRHVCHVDREKGCASCGRMCHANCDSDLCDFEPCAFCTSVHLVTHENSALCVEVQQENTGCHACGRLGCWAAAPTCYTLCTRDRHVCGPSVHGAGCSSCGRLCHENNSDVRCSYFQRMRGEVQWSANDQELMDTQAGTGGSVPHFSQVDWYFDGVTGRGSRSVPNAP